MDIGKENWQTNRKPRFAVDVFRSGATPFRASSRLNVDSELAKGMPVSQSQATTEKEYEKHCSSYAPNIFKGRDDWKHVLQFTHHQQSKIVQEEYPDNYSTSTVSETKKNVGNLYVEGSKSHPKTTSSGSSELKSSSRETPAGQLYSLNVECSSSKHNSGTAHRPTMFRKQVDMDKLRLIRTRALARRQAATIKAEENIPLNSATPLIKSLRSSMRKDTQFSSRKVFGEKFPKLTMPKETQSHIKVTSKDVQESAGSSQECCRALCFDNIQEVQEDEDQTVPLELMDMTTIISEVSVLQDPMMQQRQEQLQSRPKMNNRKNLLGYRKASNEEDFKIFSNDVENDLLNAESKLLTNENLNKFSESKYLLRNETKKVVKVGPHSRKSKIADIPKVVVYPPEPEKVEDEKETPEMCDASTNTDFKCSCGKSPDIDLIKGIVGLIEEQKEIGKKADLVREQTIARRQRMKESRALESFMTSVSPLKRLRALVQEKGSSVVNDDHASSKDSVKVTDDHVQFKDDSVYFEDCDMETSNLENTTGNESYMECTILNATSELNASHLRWKHLKLNSRVFRTPSSRPKKSKSQANTANEEQFDGQIEDDLSPFTEMAGDCERPSLAPMTPHSHHQVSMIKLSLRKQLDQLYES